MRRHPATLGFLVLLLSPFAIASVADQPSWDRAGAAKYLDDRMDAWFANAKKLRSGEAETRCVSCHTSVPYALARPMLRKSMGASAPTPQETRLIAEVTQRVQAYETHQPFYDFNEPKTRESNGTEAVLNALILASDDAWHKRTQPTDSTRKAMARLWETQRPDGAWDWLAFGLEPWESVDAPYHGATLAVLAIGNLPGAPDSHGDSARGIARLRAYLKDHFSRQTMLNRVWVLLASTRFSDLLLPAPRTALIAGIRDLQRPDGGWSLNTLGAWKWGKPEGPFAPPGALDASLLSQSDAFATGLIVFTLRQSGVPATDPGLTNGLRWLRASQREIRLNDKVWNAWRAHSLNFDREHGGEKGEPWRRLFMSDAATAFAVLALAAE